MIILPGKEKVNTKNDTKKFKNRNLQAEKKRGVTVVY